MDVQILDVKNNEVVDAVIAPILTTDFKTHKWLNSAQIRFGSFKWGECNPNEVFKLERNGEILGLIQFFPDTIHGGVQILKLESSHDNRGRAKQHDNIAGCLIAFACYVSQRLKGRGNGEAFILSRTARRQHYIDKYGMKPHDENYLKSDIRNSEELIAKYLHQ